MDPNDELPSDSDASDDDYCPDKETDQKENSEEESGKEDDEEEPDADENTKKIKQTKKKLKAGMRKRRKPAANRPRKSIKLENGKTLAASDSTSENEEDDKEKADALWADFLNDTEPQAVKETAPPKAELKKVVVEKQTATKVVVPVKEPEKLVKVFDFAGEQVTTVDGELKIESSTQIMPKLGLDKTTPASPATASSALGKFASTPRPKVGGGLGSILNQIGKKNKISTLEKTKLDWDGFKRNEGIDEELQTHNKGKDGFLERRDFLERTDYRQFEIEKNLRQGSSRRSHI